MKWYYKVAITDAIKSMLFLALLLLLFPVGFVIRDNIVEKDCKPDTVYAHIVAHPIFMDTTASVGLMEALKFYDVHHPEIVYAQAVLETGYFKSSQCLNNNNLFGLYDSKAKNYYSFDHWYESVLAYKYWIQRRYKPPEDYYKFLQRINYASDSLYTHKLKIIVKNEENKRRHTEGDSVS